LALADPKPAGLRSAMVCPMLRLRSRAFAALIALTCTFILLKSGDTA